MWNRVEYYQPCKGSCLSGEPGLTAQKIVENLSQLFISNFLGRQFELNFVGYCVVTHDDYRIEFDLNEAKFRIERLRAPLPSACEVLQTVVSLFEQVREGLVAFNKQHWPHLTLILRSAYYDWNRRRASMCWYLCHVAGPLKKLRAHRDYPDNLQSKRMIIWPKSCDVVRADYGTLRYVCNPGFKQEVRRGHRVLVVDDQSSWWAAIDHVHLAEIAYPRWEFN